MFFFSSLPHFSSQGRGKPPYLLSFTVGMATQSYVTELQAAPQASQPPQAPPQALPQPPPPAAPQPPAAATPQPQYVTELQSPPPQTQPPGSQKQYVAELPAAPAPSQPATPAPSPVAQQYIVVTVSGKFTPTFMTRTLGKSLGGVLRSIQGSSLGLPVGFGASLGKGSQVKRRYLCIPLGCSCFYLSPEKMG